MPLWFWVFTGILGGLFFIKLVYVLTIGFSLPKTHGALFVGTPRELVRIALDALPLTPGMTLVDLGCGDARILRYAVKKCKVKAVGYEINPFPYIISKIFCLGKSEIAILKKDFWHEHIGYADVVFCYLFPDVMEKLAEKLKKELCAGTWIVCFNFPLPHSKPFKVVNGERVNNGDNVYFYRVKDICPNHPPSNIPMDTYGKAPRRAVI